MSTNADGVFYGCRRAVRSMRDGGRGGAIVNIVTGQFGVPYSSAYTASKFLVQGFSKCLALEVARHGIRVNTVAPGVVPEYRLRALVSPEGRDPRDGLRRLHAGGAGLGAAARVRHA